MPEQRKKLDTDALAVLSENQRTQWAKLGGEEFKFPDDGFGPSGFGPLGGVPAGPAGSPFRETRSGGPRGNERRIGEQRPGDRPNGSSVGLDPLVGLDDARKPLRSKILAVPALRTRYLQHMRNIADKWLDWNTLGPVVAHDRSLIEREVEVDARKRSSFAAFQRATDGAVRKEVADEEPRRRFASPFHDFSLRSFADQRRQFLLNHKGHQGRD